MKTQILVLTALEIEKAAVVKHLDSVETMHHPETGTDYLHGKYGKTGSSIHLVVARTDQTNINAAIETERAIAYFQPEFVFFVGVAGGLKDVSVGDIVIGQDVYWFERGKAEDGNFKPRPKFGSSTYSLERLAMGFSRSNSWKNTSENLLNDQFAEEISIFSGTIASGEKVVASTKSDTYNFLKQNASHALAIEMEGMGFLEVCRMRPALKTLLLRGISDLVEGKGDSDAMGSQEYASANVAAFLFGLIEQLKLSNSEWNWNRNQRLIEVLCTLFPGGLRDNQIWLFSGGDLSVINLNQSGKGQWIEAIRLINLGGGGNITLESLIETVHKDFANNEDVKKLFLEFNHSD